MLVYVVIAALAFGLQAGAGAAEIGVDAHPPLPVANLVQNPGVEAGNGAAPEAWRFNTALPENFVTGWVDGGRTGKCLWMQEKTAKMSGYWSQAVPVEAGKTYLFKGQYRLAGGKMLCYVHGRAPAPGGSSVSVDERFYKGTMRGHWLVPVFLPADCLGGPDPARWYPFTLKVKIPAGLERVSFSLGIFFQAGEAWFDDLWAAPAETELAVTVKAAEGESLRRVVVRQEGARQPVLDSGPLPAGTRDFSRKLPGLATDAVYGVDATLNDGRTVTARYPKTEGEQ